MRHKPLVIIDGLLRRLPDGDRLTNTGDMYSEDYDPLGIAADAFARANHYGDYTLSNFTDAGPVAIMDVGPKIIDETAVPGMVAPGDHEHNTCCQGDMYSFLYDPLGIKADIFDRANHHGQQPLDTVIGSTPNIAGYLDVGPEEVDGSVPGKVAPSNHYHPGFMDKATYDPTLVEANPLDRANHHGTQDIDTITGLGTVSYANVGLSVVDAAAGDHTHFPFAGSSGSAGTEGFVPAPNPSDAGFVLQGDGTWESVATILLTQGVSPDSLPKMVQATDVGGVITPGQKGVPPKPYMGGENKVLSGKAQWQDIGQVLVDNPIPLPASSLPLMTPATAVEGEKGVVPAASDPNNVNQAFTGSATFRTVKQILLDSGEKVPYEKIPVMGKDMGSGGTRGLVQHPPGGGTYKVYTGSGWQEVSSLLSGPIKVDPSGVPAFTYSPPQKGMVPAPGDEAKMLTSDGTWRDVASLMSDVTFTIDPADLDVFTPPTPTEDGKQGLVPAQTSGDTVKYLASNATWIFPDPEIENFGTWSAGSPFSKNKVVKDDFASYICVTDSTSTTEPLTNTDDWQIISGQGGAGTPGADGAGFIGGDLSVEDPYEVNRDIAENGFLGRCVQYRKIFCGDHYVDTLNDTSQVAVFSGFTHMDGMFYSDAVEGRENPQDIYRRAEPFNPELSTYVTSVGNVTLTYDTHFHTVKMDAPSNMTVYGVQFFLGKSESALKDVYGGIGEPDNPVLGIAINSTGDWTDEQATREQINARNIESANLLDFTKVKIQSLQENLSWKTFWLSSPVSFNSGDTIEATMMVDLEVDYGFIPRGVPDAPFRTSTFFYNNIDTGSGSDSLSFMYHTREGGIPFRLVTSEASLQSITYTPTASPTHAYLIIDAVGDANGPMQIFASRDGGTSWVLGETYSDTYHLSNFVMVAVFDFTVVPPGTSVIWKIENRGSIVELHNTAFGWGKLGDCADFLIENTSSAGVHVASILTAATLPESPAGLRSGTLWSDPTEDHVIKVVP